MVSDVLKDDDATVFLCNVRNQSHSGTASCPSWPESSETPVRNLKSRMPVFVSVCILHCAGSNDGTSHSQFCILLSCSENFPSIENC